MIPLAGRGPVVAQDDSEPKPRWFSCRDCDVRWHGLDPTCWSCGASVATFRSYGPVMTSTGLTNVMSEDSWHRIRDRVLDEISTEEQTA